MSEIQSLFLYYGLFAICAVFAYLAHRASVRKSGFIRIIGLPDIRWSMIIPMLVAILLLSIVAGGRYGIGTDYWGYERIFQGTPHFEGVFVLVGIYRVEILSYLIVMLAKVLFGTYSGYLFLAAFITFGITVCSLFFYSKNNDAIRFDLAFFIYLCMCFAPSFNVVRQAMAASVILLGLRFIQEKKLLWYLIIVAIAMMFHFSAIFCIVFYLFNTRGNYAEIKALLVGALVLCIPVLIGPIFNIVKNYSIFATLAQYSFQNNGIELKPLLYRLPVGIILAVFSKALIEKDEKNRILLLIYVMEYVAFFMTSFNSWAFRFMMYTYVAEILLMPQIPQFFSGAGQKKVIRVMITLYYIIYFYRMFYTGGMDEVFPYVWKIV